MIRRCSVPQVLDDFSVPSWQRQAARQPRPSKGPHPQIRACLRSAPRSHDSISQSQDPLGEKNHVDSNGAYLLHP